MTKAMAKTAELVELPANTVGINPLVQAALTQDIDPEKLDKLLAVQKDYEANEARKAFHVAMSQFREVAPVIDKDSTVAYSQTAYRHTSIGHAMETINPLLSDCGLSATWKTDQGNAGGITVTCIITHAMGHSESTSLTAPPDDSGKKNNIQAIGSTITYLQRYTLFSICGLASGQDDDGNGSEPAELIDDKQAQAIRDILGELPENTEANMLTWLKIKSVEDLGKEAYQTTMNLLERKRKNA